MKKSGKSQEKFDGFDKRREGEFVLNWTKYCREKKFKNCLRFETNLRNDKSHSFHPLESFKNSHRHNIDFFLLTSQTIIMAFSIKSSQLHHCAIENNHRLHSIRLLTLIDIFLTLNTPFISAALFKPSPIQSKCLHKLIISLRLFPLSHLKLFCRREPSHRRLSLKGYRLSESRGELCGLRGAQRTLCLRAHYSTA